MAYNNTFQTHILGGGTLIPTITAGTNITLNTSGIVSGSNDTRGTFDFTANATTAPAANATLITVTFNMAFPTIPVVLLTQEVDTTATATPTSGTWYVYTASTTGFVIRCTAALAVSGRYRLNYWIIG